MRFVKMGLAAVEISIHSVTPKIKIPKATAEARGINLSGSVSTARIRIFVPNKANDRVKA